MAAGTPIFDSNAHPTLSGGWPSKSLDAHFDTLAKQIEDETILGASAVGLWKVESYDHQAFAQACAPYDKFVPVAGFAPNRGTSIKDELTELKSLGFKGIKIHPRSCQSNLVTDKEQYIETFLHAGELNLIVMYCSFLSMEIELFPDYDPLWALASILKECPDTKVILVHGGVTRVLLYAELARFNPNLLLDYSFTLMKYRGSSIDQDLRFLFSTLDQRLCLGSDFPEYTIAEVRQQAIHIAERIARHKVENIFFRNIMRFLDLDHE